MDENFSWMVIEQDEQKASLVLYNKNGLRKVLNSRPLQYASELETIKERREAMKVRIGKALQDAMQKLISNPEALKRLQEHHNQNKGA